MPTFAEIVHAAEKNFITFDYDIGGDAGVTNFRATLLPDEIELRYQKYYLGEYTLTDKERNSDGDITLGDSDEIRIKEDILRIEQTVSKKAPEWVKLYLTSQNNYVNLMVSKISNLKIVEPA